MPRSCGAARVPFAFVDSGVELILLHVHNIKVGDDGGVATIRLSFDGIRQTSLSSKLHSQRYSF